MAVAVLIISQFKAHPAVGNGIAFIAATTVSYIINSVWSFSASLDRETFGKFIAVSLVGMLLAVFISFAANYHRLHYIAGILLVALFVPPLSFLMHNFWTFRKTS